MSGINPSTIENFQYFKYVRN